MFLTHKLRIIQVIPNFVSHNFYHAVRTIYFFMFLGNLREKPTIIHLKVQHLFVFLEFT